MRKSEAERELTICSRSPGFVGGRAKLTQLTLQPIPESGCTWMYMEKVDVHGDKNSTGNRSEACLAPSDCQGLKGQ